MIQTFECAGRRFQSQDSLKEDAQQLLAQARASNLMIKCCCQSPGVPMVTRLLRGIFHLARWPDTGIQHHPDCPSYDLSSNTDLVKEREDGMIEMRTSFSLAPSPGSSVVERPTRISCHTRQREEAPLHLEDTLLHLWHLSGLDKWYPRMSGRRNWGLVRYLIEDAAGPVLIGRERLSDHLFVPEPFRNNEGGHDARQAERLNAVIGERGMALVVAPLHSIETSKFGYQFKFTHMRALRFYAKTTFGTNMVLSRIRENDRLIGIFLVDARGGYFRIHDFGFMPVSGNWLPFTDFSEAALLDDLVACNFRFVAHSGLLRSSREIAVALSSSGPSFHVIPDDHFERGWRLEEINQAERKFKS